MNFDPFFNKIFKILTFILKFRGLTILHSNIKTFGFNLNHNIHEIETKVAKLNIELKKLN